MKNNTPDGNSKVPLILKLMRKIFIMVLIMAVLLIVSSGRTDWVMAWIFISIVIVGTGINSFIMVRGNPDLIEERSRIKKDAKKWDKLLAPFMALYVPAIILLVAGLDERFGWSPEISPKVMVIALIIAILGYLLTSWALATNKFFSAIVRIQKDREHSVVSAGPYRIVRHPGYTGLMTFNIATPVILGSFWAFIPAVLTLCLTIVRTALEDKTLQDELEGYEEYARQVRYRMVPGVW
ncbi:MAG: isoprenylcysteine carboxylmethyltransferase family protein [Desulfobacterales bacterium]|nr:isoprenylcysteine carboxylmethyltransferase family protein [Desulfobacterales bacterium]